MPTKPFIRLFGRYLREQGLPVTQQREAVAEVVFSSSEHLSVDDIEQQLRKAGQRIGKATIYRTLDLLVESHLAEEHDFGEGFRRFEPVTDALPHEHLVCVRCGSVQEFQNERLERMIPLIADEFQFLHQRHRVEIFGVCRSCRSRDLGSLLA